MKSKLYIDGKFICECETDITESQFNIESEPPAPVETWEIAGSIECRPTQFLGWVQWLTSSDN